MTRFKVKQKFTDYVEAFRGQPVDEWPRVEATFRYEANNYDDLQNLLLTIIDFSEGTVKFEISKEEVED
jgi:hypothetical protein